MIAITVMAASPMPVSSRAASMLAVSQAPALSSENSEYQATDQPSARRRPSRSANHPPTVAPMNMPPKLAEVTSAIVPTDMPRYFSSPVAA